MFHKISSIIHFYSCFTSISQNVNEIAIKQLCKNFLVVDKGTVFFKDNVVRLVSAPRVKKWSIRSPKICRVSGSSRSASLSLFVEVMYIFSSGPYTGQNLYQFSLFSYKTSLEAICLAYGSVPLIAHAASFNPSVMTQLYALLTFGDHC